MLVCRNLKLSVNLYDLCRKYKNGGDVETGAGLMNVGYIFNHEFILGGGEISFLDLLSEIRRFDVVPAAFVPAKGEITRRLDSMGIKWVESPWPHLNLFTVPFFLKRVGITARQFSAQNLDLVHVNGARSMLYAGPAARRAGVPCIWHVRVLERDGIIDMVRARYATAVVANSNAVCACFIPASAAAISASQLLAPSNALAASKPAFA